MRIRTQILRNIVVTWKAGVGPERMGDLWRDACTKDVRTVRNMRGNGTRRERRVRKTAIWLETRQALLEGLKGREVVGGVHSVIFGKIGMVVGTIEAGYPALRNEVRVVSAGEVFLVPTDREDWRMLNASHWVTWGERGDFA